MAASTIPNSGGPGSSVELSPVTIAVRDKVIEKFADQPLDKMNESVKQLLAGEQDEQKRLGILAARVYILRQRIIRIAEGDPDRVVGSASPKPTNMAAESIEEQAPENLQGEWTRLRILDDCEVNGVRFPKTVIIDVKADDAEKLIANGNAELVEEDPVSSQAESEGRIEVDTAGEADDAMVTSDAPVEATADAEAEEAASEDNEIETGVEDGTAEDSTGGDDTPADDDDELSTMSAALESTSTPPLEDEAPSTSASENEGGAESVIEAPSAAEVTAALEALSMGDSGEDEDAGGSVEATVSDAEANAADVAAELEALNAAMTASDADASPSEIPGDAATDDAGFAETTEAVTEEQAQPEAEEDGADKPGGWFEAQQKAEQSPPAKAEGDEAGDETGDDATDESDDGENPDDAKA
jgi:hypothetical protein